MLTRGSDAAPVPASPVAAHHHPASTPKTAVEWRAAAVAAANARGAVHVDVVNRLKGRTSRFSDDDGPNTGIQRIAVDPGMRGEVRVIGDTTYFVANRAALAGYFGFPAAAVDRAAGHWMVLRAGDGGYAAVTEGVAFDSAMKEMAVSGPLVLLARRTMHGVRVVGIRGTVSGGTAGADPAAKATLWVSAAAPHLPVAFQAGSSKLGTMTVRFSRWGVRPKVVPPTIAVPIAQVLAG